MSIIIEGMKMPIDGKQFVVTVENGTWIFQECCKPAKIFTVSEIPSHGRLIDADALRRTMYHEAFETDSPMQKWDSGCWIRYKMFENMEENAPTIIEAEDGET